MRFRETAKTDCKRRRVCMSSRTEQLGYRKTDLREISYLNNFWKLVEKILVSLKSDMNTGYFTRGPMHICDISLNSY
jgi:hypothetical protein